MPPEYRRRHESHGVSGRGRTELYRLYHSAKIRRINAPSLIKPLSALHALTATETLRRVPKHSHRHTQLASSYDASLPLILMSRPSKTLLPRLAASSPTHTFTCSCSVGTTGGTQCSVTKTSHTLSDRGAHNSTLN